jgi:hypothetical protein
MCCGQGGRGERGGGARAPNRHAPPICTHRHDLAEARTHRTSPNEQFITPGCYGLTLRSLESFCNNKDVRQLFTQKNNWPLFNTLTINSVFFYSPWYSFSTCCHSQYFYYRLAKSLTVQRSLCENPLQCLPRLFNSFPLSTAHPNNRLLNRCVLNLPLNCRPKHPPCQLASCHP